MAGAQPSPEEMRAYVEQLRAADPADLIAEAYNLLAAGAQVKLGRPDARMLIDAMGAMVNAVGGGLPAEIAQQMAQGVAQLQAAQAQAEREMAEDPETAGAAGEAGDRPARPPGPAPSGPGPGGPGAEGADQRMTDRLWIPGRGEPPPPAP
jgi:hypothetical protein